ncbi:MAG: arginine--tRNA ligase, partial [Cytophagales bacterium]|nr:arginine--tRNA ligase [Cytophagales bacterium]
MSIEQTLQTLIGQGLAELFSMPTPPEAVPLQATRKDFEGSHTFVTFPVAKQLRRNPAEVGQQIGEYLQQHDADVVARFNVVQGFLNLTLADTVWMRLFGDMAAAADYGTQPANGRRVMVEYSSPNTNKPLHLGHLRNNFLGYAIAEILEANGCEVMKTNIVNDRGIHICKSMLAYQKFGNGETPESSGMKGDHLVGKYYVEFDKRYKEQINEIYSFWKSQSISDFKIPGNVEDYFREKIAVIIGIILSSSEESYKEDAVKIYDIAIAGLVSLKNQVSNNIERTNVVDGIIEKVQGKRNELLIIQAQQMLVKWEQGDPETVALWKKMNSWVYAGFDVTYKRMGVDFDKFYYESETYLLGKEIVAEGLEKGVFFKKDNGSVWVDLTADGLDEKLLLRGDGTSVYITQDLGLADLKHHDFPMNQSVYVVGNEQDYHFKVLFSVLR